MLMRWFLAVGLCVTLAAVAAASGGAEDRFMPNPNTARTEEAPSLPSAGGKYRVLLRKIYVPQDKGSYGQFSDYGMYTGDSWAGFNNLPPGHWVYVYPHWYIWREVANPNAKSPVRVEPRQ